MRFDFLDYCFGGTLIIIAICFLMMTIKMVFFGGFPC
jgi:hypothetical protein